MTETMVPPAVDMTEYIDGVPEMGTTDEPLMLLGGGPMYKEPTDEWVRPVSELKPENIDTEYITRLSDGSTGRAWFCDVYDLDGNQVDRWSVGWKAFWGSLSQNVQLNFMDTPNAVLRTAEHFYVSRGRWYVVDDQGDSIRFIAEKAWHAQRQQEEAAAVAPLMPAVMAGKPSWAADPTDGDVWSDEDGDGVTYNSPLAFDIGPATAYMSQNGQIRNGVVELLEAPELYVYVDDRRGYSTMELRLIAAGLVKLASDYERAIGKGLRASLDGKRSAHKGEGKG